ncbi:MAG: hypothetical protein HOQ24_07070 [Mycobacteriaceae bacterium]|nr:hypothetical protein [Mycobacteriaceae bacterium]
MAVTVLVMLGVVSVTPVLLLIRRLPPWVAPTIGLSCLATAWVMIGMTGKAHGFDRAATGVLAFTAAGLGGMTLAPSAYRIARQQPDTGDQLPVPGGPLRGGRMIGVLERVAVCGSIMAGWGPEGLVAILGVKSLARYPDLRDAKVSEQFIIGTFASVLWAVCVAAGARFHMGAVGGGKGG